MAPFSPSPGYPRGSEGPQSIPQPRVPAPRWFCLGTHNFSVPPFVTAGCLRPHVPAGSCPRGLRPQRVVTPIVANSPRAGRGGAVTRPSPLQLFPCEAFPPLNPTPSSRSSSPASSAASPAPLETRPALSITARVRLSVPSVPPGGAVPSLGQLPEEAAALSSLLPRVYFFLLQIFPALRATGHRGSREPSAPAPTGSGGAWSPR